MAVLGLNFFATSAAHSEIYKWVDENGKIHYSDKKQSLQSASVRGSNVQRIEIEDRFVLKDIKDVPPIRYTGKHPSQPIIFEQLVIDIDKPSWGQVSVGKYCDKVIPYSHDYDYLDLSDNEFSELVALEFQKNGYTAHSTVTGTAGIGGSLRLEANITDIKMQLCFPDGRRGRDMAKSALYLKVKWRLVDTWRGKTLFEEVAEGSKSNWSEPASEYKENIGVALVSSVLVSLHQVMAKRTFVDLLQPTNYVPRLASSPKEELNLRLIYGDGTGNFQKSAKYLKNSAVTVVTQAGHGSGVIVSDDGYVLTNAHVVKSEKNVGVMIDEVEYRATVHSLSEYRDVAVLKLEDYPILEVPHFSNMNLEVGAELFVIGTPLDRSLSHTITRGIYSAKRNIQGLPYYQTDAAINPGNSGGPVFDERGELVALTVSGIFTRDGGGMNVNYLIPIGDALQALNIQVVDNRSTSLGHR